MLSKYKIEFANRAIKQFQKLPRKTQLKLKTNIDQLAINPRHANTKKLSGKENLYRLRSGEYRILYQIQNKKLIVLVGCGGK